MTKNTRQVVLDAGIILLATALMGVLSAAIPHPVLYFAAIAAAFWGAARTMQAFNSTAASSPLSSNEESKDTAESRANLHGPFC